MKLENLPYNLALPGAKKQILRFFIRLSLLFTSWLAINFFVLKPTRIIDRPLTNLLTISVVKTVNFLSPSNATVSWTENADNQGSHLERNDKPIFGIGDMCNGVDLMFIYISVIMLLPYSLKRKLVFTLGGIAAIIMANIIRISSLYFIFINYHKYFNFNHHYLFTILMDVLIFYGWMLFIKKKTAV